MLQPRDVDTIDTDNTEGKIRAYQYDKMESQTHTSKLF